ncbi:hypothetical protein D3C73_1666900 [compost metagenome]
MRVARFCRLGIPILKLPLVSIPPIPWLPLIVCFSTSRFTVSRTEVKEALAAI